MKVAVAAAALIAVASCGDSVEPDTQAPAVSVNISPCCLVTIPGSQVSVEATASDNVGVAYVEFLARAPGEISPIRFAIDSSAPYAATYPPAGFPSLADGAYELSARARDGAGNKGLSAALLTVALDATPPAVTLEVPSGRITSDVPLSLLVNASEALSRVEIYAGTTLVASAIEPTLPKQLFMNVTATNNGTLALQARAWDRAGNVADSPPDTAIVDIRWRWTVTSLGTLVRGVVPDGLGNIYVVGDADPWRNAMLARLDTLGVVAWTRTFGDADPYEEGRSVAVAPGAVYMSVFRVHQNLARDCVLVKYDASGVLAWDRLIDTGSAEDDCFVATDSSGAVYIGGTTAGRFDSTLTPDNYSESFVAKYDESGNRVWVWESAGKLRVGSVGGLTVGPNGSIYLTGLGSDTLNTVTGASAYVVAIASDGSDLWWKAIVPSPAYLSGIAVDSLGSIYVSGDNYGGLDGAPTTSKPDGFVFKTDAAGTLLWVRQFGTADDDITGGVAVDAQGVYVSGFTRGTFAGLQNETTWDVFLLRFSGNGAVTDVRTYGGAGLEEGYGAATDGTGAVYLAAQMRTYRTGLVLKYRP